MLNGLFYYCDAYKSKGFTRYTLILRKYYNFLLISTELGLYYVSYTLINLDCFVLIFIDESCDFFVPFEELDGAFFFLLASSHSNQHTTTITRRGECL